MELKCLLDIKNGLSYYCRKSSIGIDVDHGFIRQFAVTTSNIYDDRTLRLLLDPDIEHECICVYLAYSSECFDDLLSHRGYECLIR